MRDEDQLTRLVLLLDFPSVTNQVDIRHPQTEATSELQQALEQHDCRLLCFVGRLFNSYAFSQQALSDTVRGDVSSRDVKHALLRLAARVVFLRYASLDTTYNVVEQTGDHRNHSAESSADRIFEWEKCLLKSLHAAMAIIIKRYPHSIQDFEVEMAWSIVGLLKRWSNEMLSPNDSRSERSRVMKDLWIESLNMLMDRRQGHEQGSNNSPTARAICQNDVVPADNSDISFMVRTINSILDGSDETKIHKIQDWAREFDTAMASCFRIFLDTNCSPIVTSRILLRMIFWSQQKDAISLGLYWIILHYLNLCLHRALGDTNMQTNGAVSATYQQNVDKLQPYFFTDKCEASGTQKNTWNEPFVAIKSFLFYGLIVLCYGPNASSSTDNDLSGDYPLQPSSLEDEVSLCRGNIYSVFWGLWQLLGPEWLYQSSMITSDINHSSFDSSDWWQRSDFTNSNGGSTSCLGQTWQICTLVRLAAGEFRLSMGRWMTCVEDKVNSVGVHKPGPHKGVVAEIRSCARIVVQAVQLMTNLADSHDDDMLDQINISDEQDTAFTPDAILHIRKSLEDALNTSVQYFNDGDFTMEKILTLSDYTVQSDWEEIGRACCLVIGTIAPELELDELLASHDKESCDHSSFVNALCSCILFSDYVAKKNQPNSKSETVHFEFDEPLSCLLPCIMSFVSSASSDSDQESIWPRESPYRVLVTLCRDANFVNVISQFLHRIYIRRQSHHDKSSHQVSITSVARLAFLIITGILEICSNEEHSSRLQLTTADANKLKTSLMHWESIL
ncbi:hypothetical protein ACHAW6_010531 [Cyclotella cf. meneghiniana]